MARRSPVALRAVAPPRGMLMLIPLRLRNDLVHDLARAAADRVEARVAEQSLDDVLAHVAVATVDLDGLIDDERAHVRRRVLRHRRELGLRFAAEKSRRDFAGERAGGR